MALMTAQPASAFTLSADLPVPELSDEEFMAELHSELKRASILSEWVLGLIMRRSFATPSMAMRTTVAVSK
jgi:hypothetical protein